MIKLPRKRLEKVRFFLTVVVTSFFVVSTLALTYVFNVKWEEKNTATSADAAISTPITRKVLVLDFNPVLEAYGNQRVRQYFGWYDPVPMESQFINDIKSASGNNYNYQIVQRMANIDKFPQKENGYVFTDEAYVATQTVGNQNPSASLLIDYPKLASDYDICGKVNRGEIDEVWMWGGPWFGFLESTPTGPGAWLVNGMPFQSSCSKRIIVWGFNYERTEKEMLHNFGHAVEGVMENIYKENPRIWTQGNYTTPWGKFGTSGVVNPNTAGCGWMHATPNATSSSQGSNFAIPNSIRSNCEDFLNYPNLTGATTQVSCSNWGCTEHGFYMWWLSHLPKANGSTNGVYNNWWKYMTLEEPSPPSAITLAYCPAATVTRDQMAVFLLKAKYGRSYTPPSAGSGTGFSDVPTNYWAAAWIKQLVAEGITAGCGGGNFCPGNPVTRDQMAVFLLKTKYGRTYNPPSVGSGTGFSDVPTNHWAAAWIKQLVAEGITAGCSTGMYCPGNPVSRDQMAVFLSKTFNLPVPPQSTSPTFCDAESGYWAFTYIEGLYNAGVTGGCGQCSQKMESQIQDLAALTPTPTSRQTPTPTRRVTPTPTTRTTATPTSPSGGGGTTVGNLLANASFESDSDGDGKPNDWSTNSRFTRTNSLRQSGSYSGLHSTTSNAGYNISQVVRNISANSDYTFSGFVNIPATSDSFTFRLELQWRNRSGSTVRTDVIKSYSSGTNGWNQFAETRRAPSDADRVSVRMVTQSLNGRVYVDNFSFVAGSGGSTGGSVSTPTPTPRQSSVFTPTPTARITSTPTPLVGGTTGNMIINSDFELDTDGNGSPDSWTSSSKFTRSNTVRNTGSYSGRHFSSSNTGYNVSQVINGISAGASYNFSGFVNIPSTSDSFTLRIEVNWRNNSGTTLRTDVLKTYSSGTAGWNNINVTRTSPSGATRAVVRMVAQSLKGPVYVDSFSLVRR